MRGTTAWKARSVVLGPSKSSQISNAQHKSSRHVLPGATWRRPRAQRAPSSDATREYVEPISGLSRQSTRPSQQSGQPPARNGPNIEERSA